jgi:hypothetical protein
VLWTLGLLTLLVAACVGLALLRAGKGLESTGAHAEPAGIAGAVDDGLVRARTALDTLAQPELSEHDVRPIASAHHRGQAYVVVGVGLLGVVACAFVGYLLFAAG